MKTNLLGYHRVRPALSTAARAKASLKSLEARLADARRLGATAQIEKLEREIAWLTVNSLTS